MTKALLVLPLLTAACLEPSFAELPDAPTSPIALQAVTQVGIAPIVIATGGAAAFAIPDVTSVGWSGEASPGFVVEPFSTIWPNTRKPEYWVRAHAAGSGTFAIATNHGIARGSIESADLARLALLPSAYQLDGHSPFALDVDRPLVTIALLDAGDRRLVDASLSILDETATTADARTWDQLAIGATPGAHTLVVSGDSLPDQRLTIEVVDHVDRIDTVRVGDRTCEHAYAGVIEVVTARTISGVPDPSAENCTLDARAR